MKYKTRCLICCNILMKIGLIIILSIFQSTMQNINKLLLTAKILINIKSNHTSRTCFQQTGRSSCSCWRRRLHRCCVRRMVGQWRTGSWDSLSLVCCLSKCRSHSLEKEHRNIEHNKRRKSLDLKHSLREFTSKQWWICDLMNIHSLWNYLLEYAPCFG